MLNNNSPKATLAVGALSLVGATLPSITRAQETTPYSDTSIWDETNVLDLSDPSKADRDLLRLLKVDQFNPEKLPVGEILNIAEEYLKTADDAGKRFIFEKIALLAANDKLALDFILNKVSSNDLAPFAIPQLVGLGERALDGLVEIAKSGSTPQSRQHAVAALGRLGPKAAPVVQAVFDLAVKDGEDATVRALAFSALADIAPNVRNILDQMVLFSKRMLLASETARIEGDAKLKADSDLILESIVQSMGRMCVRSDEAFVWLIAVALIDVSANVHALNTLVAWNQSHTTLVIIHSGQDHSKLETLMKNAIYRESFANLLLAILQTDPKLVYISFSSCCPRLEVNTDVSKENWISPIRISSCDTVDAEKLLECMEGRLNDQSGANEFLNETEFKVMREALDALTSIKFRDGIESQGVLDALLRGFEKPKAGPNTAPNAQQITGHKNSEMSSEVPAIYPSFDIREFALLYLAYFDLKSPGLSLALAKIIRDEKAGLSFRQNTVIMAGALGNKNDPALIPALTPILNSQYLVQRMEAAISLLQLGYIDHSVFEIIAPENLIGRSRRYSTSNFRERVNALLGGLRSAQKKEDPSKFAHVFGLLDNPDPRLYAIALNSVPGIPDFILKNNIVENVPPPVSGPSTQDQIESLHVERYMRDMALNFAQEIPSSRRGLVRVMPKASVVKEGNSREMDTEEINKLILRGLQSEWYSVRFYATLLPPIPGRASADVYEALEKIAESDPLPIIRRNARHTLDLYELEGDITKWLDSCLKYYVELGFINPQDIADIYKQ